MMVLTQLNNEVSFEEEVIRSGAPTLVAFIDGPAERSLTVFEKVAEENAGKLRFCTANVKEMQGTAQSLGLTHFPSFVLFRDGEVLEKSIGPAPRQILQVMLSKHV